MFINRSYKFRIYPNKIQKEYFEKCFGICRFLYNSVLDYKIKSYKEGIKYSTYDAMKDITKIKKIEGYEWLNEINAQSIQQSILDLENSFTYFYKNKYYGFPKFKKKGQKESFRNPMTYNNLKIEFNNKKIKIPKCDWIKYKDERTFEGKIKNITISKNKCNQYFASILVEEEFEQKLKTEIQESKIFSADMSCKNFLVSQEMEFENQKFYRNNERRLKIRHRKLSRKQKGSNNRQKERLKLAKFYQNIVNKRKGYQWNLIHELVQKYDVFCFEDLNIKGIQQFNSGIAKTITLDFSFYEFLRNLKWKCFKESKHFVKIDRFFPSSKLCSNCGKIKQDLKLKDRIYICDCGLEIDRDINASINIKKEGINLLKNSTYVILESNAFGDYDHWLQDQPRNYLNILEKV